MVDTTNYAEVCEVSAGQQEVRKYLTYVQAVASVEANLGPIKCLVNNAGINMGPCLFKNEPTEVLLTLHEHTEDHYTLYTYCSELVESSQREHPGDAECDFCNLPPAGW